MTGGVITGGWEFVWAAYALTAAVLTTYTISVIARLRAARRNAK
jgi:heme exporter protein D